jgi:hypothetical protein
MNDPYAVLGVSQNATDEEIKHAYRELVRKYHPDNYRDNPLGELAEQKMKEINEAYDKIQRIRSGEEQSPGGGGNGYYQNQQPNNGNYYRPPQYNYNNGPPRQNDACDCCVKLWALDCCCECMGGDLIRCC